VTSLLWSFAAWCALALAIERHHERVFPRTGGAVSRPAWCAIGLAGTLAAVLLAWRPQRCLVAAAAALSLGAVLA
jgi:hypothetical protein